MITIIAGSRTITDMRQLDKAIAECGWDITQVVSGGARGVDTLGERWALATGVPLKIVMAEWARFGRKAGPLRNAKMASQAEALILLWDGKSHGSANMLKTAKKLGLRVFEVVVGS